jgi:methylglutaconyl-CoA hydratase
MASNHLIVEIDGPVATVTMNRPDVRNALNEELIAELTDSYKSIGADKNVRVIVLRGAGQSFSSGADLAWMQKMAGYSEAENLADAKRAQEMFAAMAECPKATIVRVHGAAIGGGAGLAAACDIAIAEKDAQFGFTEVRLGLAPAVIAPFVIQKIGLGAARALFITAERFNATEAHRLGLVHKVVAIAELDQSVEETVGQVLQAGPNAIAAVKGLLAEITADSRADTTAECIARLRVSDEGQEGIKAFFEKRAPSFAVKRKIGENAP